MATPFNPGFGLGECMYQGVVPDANALLYGDYLGRVFEFRDVYQTDVGGKGTRTGLTVRVRVVRNVYGSAIAAKTVVELSPDLKTIVNPADTLNTPANLVAVVDEWLPGVGVADDDVCFVVIAGPVTAKVDATAAIAAGVGLGTTTAAKLVALDSTPADVDAAFLIHQGWAADVYTAVAKDDTTGLVYMHNPARD